MLAARTPDQLEAIAARVRGLGRRALAVPSDVNEPRALQKLVERAIAEFGRIDVLVNNAGGSPPRPALQTSEKMFEAAFHFNVTPPSCSPGSRSRTCGSRAAARS